MASVVRGPDGTARSRQLVMAEIMSNPGLARTDISNVVGLNIASVSRITRDLMDAGLVRETNQFAPKGRPGRRFVGLAPNSSGGMIIGIGMNAFRQSVTLASIENEKIAEWVSPEAPSKDGEGFIRACLKQASQMVDANVTDRRRFFGVGMAVAANLDKHSGVIQSAPTFGWERPVDVAGMVREILDAPLALDVPSSAINKSEAVFGQGRGVDNLTTLHCSLGFGIGIKKRGDDESASQEFGRVLTQSRAAGANGALLSHVCGGVALLNALHDPEHISQLSDREQGRLLTRAVAEAETNADIAKLLSELGTRTADHMSLVFDLVQPEMIILAGPLAWSADYVAAFEAALQQARDQSWASPEIRVTEMTPTGASRWLALKGNVAMGNFDLGALKIEGAA